MRIVVAVLAAIVCGCSSNPPEVVPTVTASLLDARADETIGAAFKANQCRETVLACIGWRDVTEASVVIEASDGTSYQQDWAHLATIPYSGRAANGVQVTASDWFIRARVDRMDGGHIYASFTCDPAIYTHGQQETACADEMALFQHVATVTWP